MAFTEKCRLLEAARKRLASARAHEASSRRMIDVARSMVETAKKNEEEARVQFEKCRSEVEEAGAFLMEAEKRCQVFEVVDSDGEDETEEAGRRNKKPKVKGTPAAATVVQPMAAAGARSAGDATVVEEIAVEGAGTFEVNGTYRRCRTDGSDALPYMYDGDYPAYSKGGLWKGVAVNFFLYRSI